MKQRSKFESIFGGNWVVGRYLLPELAEIGRMEEGVVLDLACGESPFEEYFGSCKKYIRVDQYYRGRGVIAGDMLALPLQPSSVDTVLLFQAISDVSVPQDLLAEIKRVISPNGRIVIFETISYPIHDLPNDYFRILPQGLKSMAEREGMVVEKCTMLGGVFARIAVLLNSHIVGQLNRFQFTRPISLFCSALVNIFFYSLEKLTFTISSAAPDYLALVRIKKKDDCLEQLF